MVRRTDRQFYESAAGATARGNQELSERRARGVVAELSEPLLGRVELYRRVSAASWRDGRLGSREECSKREEVASLGTVEAEAEGSRLVTEGAVGLALKTTAASIGVTESAMVRSLGVPTAGSARGAK